MPSHGAIVNNIGRFLGNVLLDRNCTVFNSDVKYFFVNENALLNPDVSVVCGKIQGAAKNPQALINPVMLVEVNSESKADQHPGRKIRIYSQINHTGVFTGGAGSKTDTAILLGIVREYLANGLDRKSAGILPEEPENQHFIKPGLSKG